MEQEKFHYKYQGYTISGFRAWDNSTWYGTVYQNSIPVFSENSKDREYLKAMLEQYVKDIKFSFGGY
jgi:hypothetical protein